MDDKVPVSTLLRKSLVIAYKLDLQGFGAWVERKHDSIVNDEEIEIVFEITSFLMKHLVRMSKKT